MKKPQQQRARTVRITSKTARSVAQDEVEAVTKKPLSIKRQTAAAGTKRGRRG